MEPNGRESHKEENRHYYVAQKPENGVNQSVWGNPRSQTNQQPVTAHPSLYKQALVSAWPLRWPQGTQEEKTCLLALSDAQIDDSLKDKYCPCISAFEHECCGCKGNPGQKNFHENWEEHMVKSGGWAERTKALQKVFEGKGFVEQGEYTNLNYSKATIWDVLHQEPTIMVKFIVKPWKNFEDVWKTFKNQVEDIRNQIAGQIHAIVQVYSSILQVLSIVENQVLVYKAPFAPDLVTVMKSAVIMFGRFVIELESKCPDLKRGKVHSVNLAWRRLMILEERRTK